VILPIELNWPLFLPSPRPRGQPLMDDNPIRILTAEPDSDGLVVTFTEGTTAGYDLRPQRLRSADIRDLPPNPVG
jgi:hypothetical protein